MPGINGPLLVMEIQKIYPTMKVLFISGYTEENFAFRSKQEHSFNFLPKPFTLNSLMAKVREVLEQD